MPEPFSAVVLAGGRSTRLGRDKAVERIGGERLLDRVLRLTGGLAEELVVVVDAPETVERLGVPDTARTVVDAFPGGGSLGGIATGLRSVRHEWAFVVACDMPFLNPRLLRHLAHRRHGFDAVVPLVEGRPQPTHALYSTRCLAPMEERLRRGELKIAPAFDHLRVNYLPETEVQRFDPELASFFNVNTEEDLRHARQREASYG